MEKKIKICGMTDRDNIQAVLPLRPDYLGFIFYPQSKRYVGEAFDLSIVRQLHSVRTTAVFVNADRPRVERVIADGLFDAVQLHGEEDAAFCRAIRKTGTTVIKAFGIHPAFDWKHLLAYQEAVDYFLFDTHTAAYGGSGRPFDWSLLAAYPLAVPYFLSGGIAPQNIEAARQLSDPRLHALDLNSQFESRAGIKDIVLLQSILKKES